jgi:hypothetical protein
VLDELPQWRASGQLVPYAIVDGATGGLLGGATLRRLDAPGVSSFPSSSTRNTRKPSSVP